MGLYDRDYTQSDARRQHFGMPQMRFNMPRLTPVVKWLLIVNIGVYILGMVPAIGHALEQWFAVTPATWSTTLQPWRLITYQFLHSRTYLLHIVFNMFGLYFFGPPLERFWGSRRFLPFYLACGASGGVLYLLLARIGFLGAGLMVGASGAIMGLISACAILFPHATVIFFIFPVPIRVFAVVVAVLSFMRIIGQDSNAGGEAAHFAGLAVGAAWVLLYPRWDRFVMKMRAGSWEKRLQESRRLQIEVDRILAKVHRSGLHSLTVREKRILRKATQEELRRHQL